MKRQIRWMLIFYHFALSNREIVISPSFQGRLCAKGARLFAPSLEAAVIDPLPA